MEPVLEALISEYGPGLLLCAVLALSVLIALVI